MSDHLRAGGPWKSPLARFGVCWVLCEVALRACDIVCFGVCTDLSVLRPVLFLQEKSELRVGTTLSGSQTHAFRSLSALAFWGRFPWWEGS